MVLFLIVAELSISTKSVRLPSDIVHILRPVRDKYLSTISYRYEELNTQKNEP